MPRTTLYLTFDGVLSPLGHSQVIRVIEGLARRGHPYHLVSLERAADLASKDVESLRRRLKEVGIGWSILDYDPAASPRAAATNLARATWTVVRLSRSQTVGRVHARGYQSALVALTARTAAGVPYIFDARGYWIDERLNEGRWFGNPRVYRLAKALERRLYGRADAVVTLTELQERDLREGALGVRCDRVVTIPTCADFDSFTRRPPEQARSVPAAIRERLAGRRVVAVVGSVNASYEVEATYRLCRHAVDLAPDVHVLIVSEQRSAAEAMLGRHGIAADRATIAQAPHEDMPDWLSLVDWAVLLLRENFAKRASMPTKLAEFFAAGVRPLHHGCNPEVARWVETVGTGLHLESLAEAELSRAARFVVATPRDPVVLAAGRERAEPHFSLRAGLARYQSLLSSLG